MNFEELSAVFDSWIGVACPGAALEVRRRGDVVFRRVGGFTAVEPDEAGAHAVRVPVTEETVFDLASVTKPLSTAMLTAIACDAGELSLHASLGDFGGLFATPVRAGVPVRDILLHRAAFPAWLPFGQRLIPVKGIETAGSDMARADCLLIATGAGLEGAPGRDILYSDVGYIVLGMLLEQACGEGLADLFHERVVRPLGLARTGFMPIVPAVGPVTPACGSIAATAWCPLRQRVMQGEVHDDNAWFLGGAAGHAGLFSTVSETADLVAAWIDAAGGASRLLGRQTAAAFIFDDVGEPGVGRTPGFDRPSPSGSNAGDLRPAGTVGHLGFTGTSFWFDRDSGLSIVLLTNRANPEMYGRQAEIKAMRRAVYDAAWKVAR